MFGLSAVLALVQCIALFFVPKSPRLLVIKGHPDEVSLNFVSLTLLSSYNNNIVQKILT